MSNEHKRAPGFIRRREHDGPVNGHEIQPEPHYHAPAFPPPQQDNLTEVEMRRVARTESDYRYLRALDNDRRALAGLENMWPCDRAPTQVSPAEILREERPPVTREQRLRAAVRVALAVAYLVVFALSVYGLSALFSDARSAENTWLVANLGSYHPDSQYAREKHLTGVNPGLGVEYAMRDDLRLVGGAYRNSYRHTSAYAGAAWQPVEVLGARVGVLGGLVNGYPVHEGRFGPFVAAVASVEIGRAGFNLVLLPKVRDKAHGAIALQVKWGL